MRDMNMTRRLLSAALVCAATWCAVPACHAYEREGPASGGGFEPTVPSEQSGTTYTTQEVKRMGCSGRDVPEAVSGRNKYINCHGAWLLKDYRGGRTTYVVVPSPVG